MRKKSIIGITTLVAGLGALLAFGAWTPLTGAPQQGATVRVNQDDLPGAHCEDVPIDEDEHANLQAALQAALADAKGEDNGGFGLDMWGTIVNRDGVVCAVAFTGEDRGDQWPGSRVISAQKANTANAFSLPGLALSTANLFTAVQPGGSLFGLQESNPVDTGAAYAGPFENYGQHGDPLEGQRIGGVNVFGGGLALYDDEDNLLGALGVSGDTSCADHNIAWKTRHFLGLNHVPGGVSATGDDNIVYDITTIPPPTGHPTSAGGFGHPDCGLGERPIAEDLPNSHPIGE